MDWQLICVIAVSAGAFVAFIALGPSKEEPATVQPQRKVQGLDVIKPAPAPRVHDETTRRFIEALKAQS